MNLPQEFTVRMKAMLGEDYEAFLASYLRPETPALRIHPRKQDPSSPLTLSCLGEAVPWAEGGYYYRTEDGLRPGKHPYHEAGVYYIQEASAMLPASLCPPVPGDRVLDLCAAPGGKTTQLSAALQGEGVLVANEIHPQRAAVLSQNVERMGIANAVVTCHAPHELVAHFAGFFDKIVVDAPCSGEGMFRKEEQALSMWSQENVDLCAARQKEILASAAKMLAPDGYLTYSTCTFAPEENEGVILHFLQEHPEFEAVEPKNPLVLAALEQGLLDRGDPQWVDAEEVRAEALRKSLRVFPHHCHGEGHFAALLHKKADASSEPSCFSCKEKKKKKGQDNKMPSQEQAMALWEEFLLQIGGERPAGVPCLFGEQLNFCPEAIPAPIPGLRTLRHGLQVGQIVNGRRFEPSHSWALSLCPHQVKQCFAVEEEEAKAYLRGEELVCGAQRGWHLISFRGYSLGWGKAADGRMKNHYPKGLRKSL